MTITVSELEVLIKGNVKNLKNDLGEADKQVDGFAARTARKMGDAAVRIGAIGVGIAAAIGGASIKAAIDFETQFAEVRKTVDGTDDELEDLRDTIREMATNKDNPVSSLENAHETLAKIAALGGSLGIPLKDLDMFVETVADLTVASDLSAESASNFLGRFSNVTGMATKDFPRAASAIVDLGNKMAATESEIAEFANRLAPLSTFKFNPQQILGLSAAMASLGMEPQLAGSSMLRTISDIVTSAATGKNLQGFADIAGTSADNFKKLAETDTPQAFLDFIDGLNKLPPEERILALNKIGIVETGQVTTLLKLASGVDTMADGLRIANEGWDDGKKHIEEAGKKAATTQGQLNLLNNKVRDLGISLGDKLLPHFNKFVDGAIKLTEGDTGGGLHDIAVALGEIGTQAIGMGDVDVEAGLGAWQGIFDNLGKIKDLIAEPFEVGFHAIQLFLDNIIRGIDRFIIEANLKLLDFVAGMRDLGLKIGVDIAPDITSAQAEAVGELATRDWADRITEMLQEQIANNKLDLRALAFDPATTGGFEITLAQLISNPDVVNQMSLAGKDAIQQAIAIAIEQGSQDVPGLLQLAQFIGIDTTEFEAMVQAKAQEAINSGVDAAGAVVYTVAVKADVTVTPGSVFTSGFDAAIAGATSGATGGSSGPSPSPIPHFQGGGAFYDPSGAGLAFLHSGETVRTKAQERALERRMRSGGAGDTFYVNSYGENPYKLVSLMKRAQRNMSR